MVVIFVILIAVGVHSCQVSSDQSALKDYTNSVSSLISRSDATGKTLFSVLSSGGGSASGLSLQNRIDENRQTALAVLSDAQKMSAPDSVKTANANLLLALQMRVDGITIIAGKIQAAVGGTTSSDAVSSIATEMARFYASDVLYKDYTAPAIASALHANGIAVGGTINAGQFVPDVQWLLPSHIAAELKVSLPAAGGGGGRTSATGCNPCGHSLNSVSVNGTTLQTGSPNTIPAKPAPTFRLSITNGGNKNESNVVCKVTVNGTSDSGQTTIPQTTAGQTTTCDVPLKSAPAAGTYTVQATVAPVPGEKNLSNNSQGYTVTFG